MPLSGFLLEFAEERFSNAFPPRFRMDEHLRDLGPVRLIGRHGKEELNGADDALPFSGDEDDPFVAGSGGGNGVGPESSSLVEGEGKNEPNARTGIDAGVQNFRQCLSLEKDVLGIESLDLHGP